MHGHVHGYDVMRAPKQGCTVRPVQPKSRGTVRYTVGTVKGGGVRPHSTLRCRHPFATPSEWAHATQAIQSSLPMLISTM
eukprot:358424-Chlamydomonas_euryale.AAC.4